MENKERKCNCWLDNDTCYCEVDKENSDLCGQCQGDKECYCK